MVIRCKLCKDILIGDMRGTFISCTCGACFIDETKYYTRIGGEERHIEYISNEEAAKELLNKIKNNTFIEISGEKYRKVTTRTALKFKALGQDMITCSDGYFINENWRPLNEKNENSV